MQLTLELLHETPKARLYKFKSGDKLWIPRSVTTHTSKIPPKDPLDNPIHIIDIEDWFCEKNIPDHFYNDDDETPSELDDRLDHLL